MCCILERRAHGRNPQTGNGRPANNPGCAPGWHQRSSHGTTEGTEPVTSCDSRFFYYAGKRRVAHCPRCDSSRVYSWNQRGFTEWLCGLTFFTHKCRWCRTRYLELFHSRAPDSVLRLTGRLNLKNSRPSLGTWHGDHPRHGPRPREQESPVLLRPSRHVCAGEFWRNPSTIPCTSRNPGERPNIRSLVSDLQFTPSAWR